MSHSVRHDVMISNKNHQEMKRAERGERGENEPITRAFAHCQLRRGADEIKQRDPNRNQRAECRGQPNAPKQIEQPDSENRKTRGIVHDPNQSVNVTARRIVFCDEKRKRFERAALCWNRAAKIKEERKEKMQRAENQRERAANV